MQEGEESVMAYGFRLCVTTDPANRVPFPEPKEYDPARFELARRYFKKYPDAPSPWELRPLPGNKFDADHATDAGFSMELVGEARAVVPRRRGRATPACGRSIASTPWSSTGS